MGDPQDQAENLDDDELDGAYPPDKLLGAEAYGEAGTDPGAPESVERRAAREEPEEVPGQLGDEAYGTEGPLDPEDSFGGDESLRDVVQEREAPIPAEEQAIHLVDEDLDFDSEVDDPALEAAWETDPEVER